MRTVQEVENLNRDMPGESSRVKRGKREIQVIE